MKTAAKVEAEFRAELQALLDRYGAEITAESHWQGCAECGEDLHFECNWLPIETAPKDNKRPLFIATFGSDGSMQAFDYNASWESAQESWETPELYWYWASESGNVEEPTHWMYQPEGFYRP